MTFTFNEVDYLDRLEYLEAREKDRLQKEEQELEKERQADRQRIVNTRRIQKESIENEEKHRIKVHKIASIIFFSLIIILITICVTMSIIFKVYNVYNPDMASYFTTNTVTLLNNLEWSIIVIALLPIIVSCSVCGIYSQDMSDYQWNLKCFYENWCEYDKNGFLIKKKI